MKEGKFKSAARHTKASERYHVRAQRLMPGGVTANVKYFAPYPLAMKRANGARLWDLDGNEYIDYCLSFGPLILGHGHPAVLAAIRGALENAGTTTATTRRLIHGIRESLERRDAPAVVSGLGTVLSILFADRPPRNYRDAMNADSQRRKALDRALLARGVFVKPESPFYLSTAHDDAAIAETLSVFREVVPSLP